MAPSGEASSNPAPESTLDHNGGLGSSAVARAGLGALGAGVASAGLAGLLGGFVGGLGGTEILFTLGIGALAAAASTLVMIGRWRSAGPGLAEAEFDQVAYEATHDMLTGLPNRAELIRLLDEAVEAESVGDDALGVLFLDLDGFKAINDSLGHDVGDQLLRIVAERLRSTVRGTDVVARLGGDEFVVICRDLQVPDVAVAMARQILGRFDDPVVLNGQDHRVGLSVGVAVGIAGGDRSAEDLLRNADAAMYRAKRLKSGYAVFDDAHRLLLADRHSIEQDLREALDRAELVVHYHPVVDTGEERIHSLEALVRWVHPTRGELGPGDFLEIATDARLVSRIDHLVLEQVCAQAATWNRVTPAARKVKFCMNVGEHLLVDPDFVSRVADALDRCQVGADQLVLEIPEAIIVGHLERLEALRQLRALGVELLIDDFGTGVSMLGYLRQLDMVSGAKIDATLVRDMNSGLADRAVVEAALALAAGRGMRVMAEGVESQEQFDLLSRMGIDLMQGYLFAAPVAPETIDPVRWFGIGDDGGQPGVGSRSGRTPKRSTDGAFQRAIDGLQGSLSPSAVGQRSR